MTQVERLDYLIHYLLNEEEQYQDIQIPKDITNKQKLLRSLMNVWLPLAIDEEFLKVQDEYLKERIKEKGITKLQELKQIQNGIYLWQGDITTLEVDAIVNAANAQMLGCFVPCHGCIDNAIHTYAGIKLRLECAKIMEAQGHEEPTGQAKITNAYNLPCNYILHTVGPIIYGDVTKKDQEALASCYRSCLDLAKDNGTKSIAFCCISTGEFHFPNQLAAQIAIETVKTWQKENPEKIEVIFNVFKDQDYRIYKQLLQ